MEKTQRILTVIAVVSVVLGVIVVIVHKPGTLVPPKPMTTTALATYVPLTLTPVPTTPPIPLEYQLAQINAGGYVSENDVTVVRFRYLLTSIAHKTKNTPEQISDMTVRGRTLLREKFGKEIKLLELMEGANDSIPDDSPIKFDYAEIISALVVLMGR